LAGIGIEVLLSTLLWSIDAAISDKLVAQLLELRQLSANHNISVDDMNIISKNLSGFPTNRAKSRYSRSTSKAYSLLCTINSG